MNAIAQELRKEANKEADAKHAAGMAAVAESQAKTAQRTSNYDRPFQPLTEDKNGYYDPPPRPVLQAEAEELSFIDQYKWYLLGAGAVVLLLLGLFLL